MERCPVCKRESLEDVKTGEEVYRENAHKFAGRELKCSWGCWQGKRETHG